MWKSLFKCSKNQEYSYAIFESITNIPTKEWDAINTKNNIYLSSSFLKAFEKGMHEKTNFRYVLFYNSQQEAIGISYLQIISFKPNEFLQNKIPCTVADKVKKYFFEDKKLNVLLCGNLFACGENGFAHTEAIEKPLFLELIHHAMAAISSKEPKKISFHLFKEFWETSTSVSDHLKKQSFKGFYIDVNMVVPIKNTWTCCDDYLGDMNTKYRTRAKKVYKTSKNLRKENFSVADIQKYLPEIQRMYTDVLKKADYNLGTLNVATFVHLKEELQDKFIMSGYFSEDQFIGFSSAFAFNGTIDANFVGIDYEYNKEYKLYQRMLFDFVELAIDRKTYELRLGRTAETIKSVVGAKPVSMKLYAKHRNSISTSLLGLVLSSINPSRYEIRNPFKN
ncbi:hypothetical protein [Flavicella sediminum]|uniref:hypothetical protein n=1 Tax=Flavicella sediminum TaxID=2585141 RepID=UPI0011227B5A|nr:hypothetical protein [Flavicella sediminum]